MTGWLCRHDSEYTALRKAVRTTVTACAGFFLCRYGLGDPLMATYAIFSAIALGALSDVFGPPAVRTKVYLAALPAAAALVSLGTLLAGQTWTAVLGMLVVGFTVAYAGVGGPRLVGLANGMQLFYVLPCFPPYAPETLPARLVGVAIGVGLVIVADRVLMPAPTPARFSTRIANAADVVATYLEAIRDHPGQGQYELRALSRQTLAELKLSSVPLDERPNGPGRRDRGLTHAASAIRIIGARSEVLDHLPCQPDAPPVALTSALLDQVRALLNQTSAALRGIGPAPVAGPLTATVDDYLRRRTRWVADRGERTEPPEGLRAGVAALAIAESTLGLVAATRAAVGAAAEATDPPPTAWYAKAPVLALWSERVLGNLTPRSVYLQNALRLAIGLAAARVAVDLLHLNHGLWVLLATLTLMRTTLVAAGTALVPAFAGTLIGAALGAGLLTLVGGHDTVYAVVLPLVMLAAFTVGPVLGPLYGQAGFTVVVAAVFAQLAPASWTLAGDRVLDVVTGGLIGTAIGAAVWPRGGAGEIRRIAVCALRAGAEDLVGTVDALGGLRPSAPAYSATAKLAVLFENTYSQYRTEPGHAERRRDEADWLGVLGVLRRLAGDADVLLRRHPEVSPLPWPAVASRIDDAASEVADGYREVADAIAARRGSRCGATALVADLTAAPPRAPFASAPHAALRALDAWGWLHALAHDLDRVERAVTPVATPAHRRVKTAAQRS